MSTDRRQCINLSHHLGVRVRFRFRFRVRVRVRVMWLRIEEV